MSSSERLAPITPLFRGGPDDTSVSPGLAVPDARDEQDASARTVDAREVIAAAEAVLLRKLRTRSLSVREARTVLLERGLDESQAEELLEHFLRLGYLDDRALAEQLIHTGTERKGQGRMMLRQTLSGRGIPRDCIDEVMAELPDDEFERAMEFARSKARSMSTLDRDTALRRLSGQLARRGYGAVALSAARQALEEAARPPARGVRFE